MNWELNLQSLDHVPNILTVTNHKVLANISYKSKHPFAVQLTWVLTFLVQNEDNTGRHNNNLDGLPPIQTNWCPHLCHPHHFYAGCPSWHIPPNLSWLGTGTKYAVLHTRKYPTISRIFWSQKNTGDLPDFQSGALTPYVCKCCWSAKSENP